jgi:thiosulfate dehydrogenase [quinone] large subunit
MEINRRNFLCGALLTALGTTTASAQNAHAATGVKRLSDGSVEVTPASIKALRKVGGVALIGEVSGAPTALVRTGAKRYVALDMRCTHAGITVKPEGTGFYCAPQVGGHGSAFTGTGAVSQGPAEEPLNRLSVKARGKKLIVS